MNILKGSKKCIILNNMAFFLTDFGHNCCEVTENIAYHRAELKREGAPVNKRFEPLEVWGEMSGVFP